MVQVTFLDLSGNPTTINAPGGQSLMEVAVQHGISGIEGICGGACACGTCHVWVDAAWLAKVGPPSEMEGEMLSGLEGRKPSSRLACQLKLAQPFDGLVVTPVSGG